MVGDEASATTVFGANFSAGFVAGILAASATCPLDVARTRRQIEVGLLSSPIFIHLNNLYKKQLTERVIIHCESFLGSHE